MTINASGYAERLEVREIGRGSNGDDVEMGEVGKLSGVETGDCCSAVDAFRCQEMCLKEW